MFNRYTILKVICLTILIFNSENPITINVAQAIILPPPPPPPPPLPSSPKNFLPIQAKQKMQQSKNTTSNIVVKPSAKELKSEREKIRRRSIIEFTAEQKRIIHEYINKQATSKYKTFPSSNSTGEATMQKALQNILATMRPAIKQSSSDSESDNPNNKSGNNSEWDDKYENNKSSKECENNSLETIKKIYKN